MECSGAGRQRRRPEIGRGGKRGNGFARPPRRLWKHAVAVLYFLSAGMILARWIVPGFLPRGLLPAHGRVAQLAEHSALNRQVEGSIPSASTNLKKHILGAANSGASLCARRRSCCPTLSARNKAERMGRGACGVGLYGLFEFVLSQVPKSGPGAPGYGNSRSG